MNRKHKQGEMEYAIQSYLVNTNDLELFYQVFSEYAKYYNNKESIKYNNTLGLPYIILHICIGAVSPNPLEMIINMVIAIKVMPERGDQLVRPIHSESITPAIHIQRVPITAMKMPLASPISSVDITAMTANTIAEPKIAT